MIKTISLLLISLLGISFSLDAIPMERNIREPVDQPRPVLDRRENPIDSGSVSDEATRGMLGAGIGRSSTAGDETENESSLTIDHFQTALAENPTAARLIIIEDEKGAICIQPCAAGTSRLALKKNQIENETILEELRALLATRYGEEAADSFFIGMNNLENAPLSAERLREILRRSETDSNTSQKILSPKTPTVNRSGSEATRPFGGSGIHQELGADIRNHILITEKVNVATSALEEQQKATANFQRLQKAERRKKREQKILGGSATALMKAAPALESEAEEGYLTAGTFLRQAVLKTAQAEAASSLLQGAVSLSQASLPPVPENKKLSAAERDVEDFTHIAEGKRTHAREASLAAEKMKKRAASASEKSNLEEETATYAEAEEAWNDTAAAYRATIKKAIKATLDTKELTTAAEEATAHLLYWRSAGLEVSAKKLEFSSPALNNMSIKQAETLESAWHEALQGYQDAISKAELVALTDEIKEWASDLQNAQTRENFWTTTISSLDQKERTAVEALQQEAQQLATAATALATTASHAADTIEATHWRTAIQKGAEAEATRQEAFEAYQINHNQTLERFKNWWSEEIQKISNHQKSLSGTIESWKSQKAESIVRAQANVKEALERTDQQEADDRVAAIRVKVTTAQARVMALQKETKEKIAIADKADQEAANTRIATAREKVNSATNKVNEATSRVTTAQASLQQATSSAEAATAAISEAEEKVARYLRTRDEVNARIQDAHARAEKQKYSFRNFVSSLCVPTLSSSEIGYTNSFSLFLLELGEI